MGGYHLSVVNTTSNGHAAIIKNEKIKPGRLLQEPCSSLDSAQMLPPWGHSLSHHDQAFSVWSVPSIGCKGWLLGMHSLDSQPVGQDGFSKSLSPKIFTLQFITVAK